MCGALVAPVCDEHGTVRSGFAINRPERHVVGFKERTTEVSFETGTITLQHVPVNCVRQQIACDVRAVETCGKRAALIDNPAVGDMASFESAVRDVIEITEGIRV